jgi:hypothetical protein
MLNQRLLKMQINFKRSYAQTTPAPEQVKKRLLPGIDLASRRRGKLSPAPFSGMQVTLNLKQSKNRRS